MTLLSGTIQPPLLTLLSSTSDPSLSSLFTITSDPDQPNDSFISTLPDTSTSEASSSSSRSARSGSGPGSKRGFDKHYVARSEDEFRGNAIGQIIHIQSPDPRTTYIQAGSSKSKGKGKEKATLDYNASEHHPLGIELPWVGIQAKRLGRRGMSFEFGIVDAKGREGVIRVSSYKSNPTVHPHRTPPLIHLPLELPKTDQHTLTHWLDIKLNLASLLPLFNTLPRPQIENEAGNEDRVDRKRRKVAEKVELPNDQFGYVRYVRVYANCRLRRIWFSADGERTLDQAGVKDEWALYASPT